VLPLSLNRGFGFEFQTARILHRLPRQQKAIQRFLKKMFDSEPNYFAQSDFLIPRNPSNGLESNIPNRDGALGRRLQVWTRQRPESLHT
jgi:hypothetical protein